MKPTWVYGIKSEDGFATATLQVDVDRWGLIFYKGFVEVEKPGEPVYRSELKGLHELERYGFEAPDYRQDILDKIREEEDRKQEQL